MVWLGHEWLGLAWELKKNSRASNMPRGPTGGQTNCHKRLEQEINANPVAVLMTEKKMST